MMLENDAKKMAEKHYPGSYYDVKGLEKWLTEMGKQGWRLVRQDDTPKALLFSQEEPAYVRFFLVPDIKKKDKRSNGELAEQYAGQGWKFICRIPGQVIIYETDDLWAVKPSIDLTEADYRRKWRSLRANMVAWLALVAVMIGIVVWGLLSESVTYYDRITVWPWVFLASTLLPVALAVLDILEIFDLYAWWKHYRRQEEIPQWRAASTLRWTKRVGSWVAFAAALSVPFLELVTDHKDYNLVSDLEKENIPMVTLALASGRDTLDSCGVYEKSHLLIPDEIGVKTLQKWPDGRWDYMTFTYYRLRGETMAHRLAESEAEKAEVWRYEPALLVETNCGFDEVWLSDGEERFQYLTACIGDVAITIKLDAEDDLLSALPEIYDIVTEYRANT